MSWIKIGKEKEFVANFRILFENLPPVLRKQDTPLTELSTTHLQANIWSSCHPEYQLSFLSSFVPIPGLGLPFRGFVIVLFGRTTLGRTAVNDWSAGRRYLSDITQRSQERDIHAFGGTGTRDPSNRAATNPRLRPRSHRHRHPSVNCKCWFSTGPSLPVKR